MATMKGFLVTHDPMLVSWYQLGVLIAEAHRRLLAAPTASRSEAIWMGKCQRLTDALHARGLTARRWHDGTYEVGRPADFVPLQGHY